MRRRALRGLPREPRLHAPPERSLQLGRGYVHDRGRSHTAAAGPAAHTRTCAGIKDAEVGRDATTAAAG